MSTTTPVLGKALTLRAGNSSTTTGITNLRSSSLNDSSDMIETTTVNSAAYKEYLASFADATIDFEGVYTQTATTSGYEDLETWKAAGTLIYWEFGTGVTGTPKMTGRGLIKDLKRTHDYKDVVMFSGSIQNSGDPTIGVYP